MDTKNEGMGLEQNLALFVLKIRTKSAKNVTLLLNFRQKRHFFSERKKRAFSRGKVDTFPFLTYNCVKQSGLRSHPAIFIKMIFFMQNLVQPAAVKTGEEPVNS